MIPFGLSPPELGLLGVVIAALIGGVLRFWGTVKAALITAESETDDDPAPRNESPDNGSSAGEGTSGDQMTNIVAGGDVNYGPQGPSDNTDGPENETDSPLAEEDYPYASYCSSVWANISMTEWEYRPETDETVARGKVRNTVNARYNVQITIQYDDPNDEREIMEFCSTIVALDPGKTESWRIFVGKQAEDPKLCDPWVRECTSVDPPWDTLPIDYTDYPECTEYTTIPTVEQKTAVRDQTHVFIRIDNLFSRDITVEFWIEFVLNGVSQSTNEKAEPIGAGNEVTVREVIDAPRESVADVRVGTPDTEKDCRLIYGEP